MNVALSYPSPCIHAMDKCSCWLSFSINSVTLDNYIGLFMSPFLLSQGYQVGWWIMVYWWSTGSIPKQGHNHNQYKGYWWIVMVENGEGLRTITNGLLGTITWVLELPHWNYSHRIAWNIPSQISVNFFFPQENSEEHVRNQQKLTAWLMVNGIWPSFFRAGFPFKRYGCGMLWSMPCTPGCSLSITKEVELLGWSSIHFWGSWLIPSCGMQRTPGTKALWKQSEPSPVPRFDGALEATARLISYNFCH